MSRRSLLVFGALLTAAACGDARIRKLSENITKDSVLKILGEGAAKPGDSLPHVYRQAGYFTKGKLYTILFFTPTDRTETTDTLEKQEPILDNKLTPIVLVADTLKGWGWSDWEKIAKTINVEVPKRR